jgi:hypothetical protein
MYSTTSSFHLKLECAIVQVMVEGELDEALMRAIRPAFQSSGADADWPVGATPPAWPSLTFVMGTFGRTEITVSVRRPDSRMGNRRSGSARHCGAISAAR